MSYYDKLILNFKFKPVRMQYVCIYKKHRVTVYNLYKGRQN